MDYKGILRNGFLATVLAIPAIFGGCAGTNSSTLSSLGAPIAPTVPTSGTPASSSTIPTAPTSGASVPTGSGSSGTPIVSGGASLEQRTIGAEHYLPIVGLALAAGGLIYGARRKRKGKTFIPGVSLEILRRSGAPNYAMRTRDAARAYGGHVLNTV